MKRINKVAIVLQFIITGLISFGLGFFTWKYLPQLPGLAVFVAGLPFVMPLDRIFLILTSDQIAVLRLFRRHAVKVGKNSPVLNLLWWLTDVIYFSATPQPWKFTPSLGATKHTKDQWNIAGLKKLMEPVLSRISNSSKKTEFKSRMNAIITELEAFNNDHPQQGEMVYRIMDFGHQYQFIGTVPLDNSLMNAVNNRLPIDDEVNMLDEARFTQMMQETVDQFSTKLISDQPWTVLTQTRVVNDIINWLVFADESPENPFYLYHLEKWGKLSVEKPVAQQGLLDRLLDTESARLDKLSAKDRSEAEATELEVTVNRLKNLFDYDKVTGPVVDPQRKERILDRITTILSIRGNDDLLIDPKQMISNKK